MDDIFREDEKLYRAVYPPEVVSMFWRRDGSLSSAAFADPKGLSVDREGDRSEAEAISSMKERFLGQIVFVRYRNCRQVGAVVRYLPSSHNPYHSEIHGSESSPLLSKSQRRHLAEKACVAECDNK